MKYAHIENDMITSFLEGHGTGVKIPDELYSLPTERLRFSDDADADAVVDVAAFNSFFIDEFGRKHIIQHVSEWQPLDCTWDAVIINDGTWRLMTNADRLSDAKVNATQSIHEFATYIRAKITDNADQYKLAGWNAKVPFAERIIAGTASTEEIAILQAECDKRGKDETPLELANKQIEKALELAKCAAVIDGMESASIEAIDNQTAIADITDLLDVLKADAESELVTLLSA